MIYIIAAICIVGGVFGFGFLCLKAIESESFVSGWTIGLVIYTVILLAFLIAAADASEQKGPCVQYETRMYYNAAVKGMMPARVCTARGEWVND